MDAIRTFRGGIAYRSRLEARWAAFFDLVRWKYFYEPFDLDGYIPDFVIHGCKSTRILVEVKPVSDSADPLLAETMQKIEKSGWKGEALILSYHFPQDDGRRQNLGWFGETCEFWEGLNWAMAPFQDTGDSDVVVGFCHEFGSYHDRITGYYPGGSTGTFVDVDELWNSAGNAVQWRP